MSHTNGGKAVTTQFDYNNYGNVTSQTDSLGHTSYYSYDTGKGLLDYITNANNHRTKYVYDVGGKLTELFNDVDKGGVHDSGEAGVSYTYNSKDYLTEINNGATVYHFAYDNYGNVTSVSIGTNTTPLVSYSYAGYNGKLLSTTYADGTTVSNTYDSLSRIKTVSYNGVLAYTVTYDGNSNVSSYTDCATGRVYRYEYDALGRALRYYVTLNNAPIYESEVVYDTYGRETGYSYSISGVNSRTSTNTYDQHNRISQTSSAAGDTIQYYYDSLGRVISKQTGDFSECYEYLDNSSDSAKTSSLISKITLKYNGITTRTIEYTYDNLGNILTEDDGVTFRQYTYDSLNQLASESYYDKNTLAGECKYYFNSSNGNIGFVKFAIINGIYHNIGSSGHSYGNGTDWKELLTSYDGTPITYDANGNPLSYYNGQNYTFTWQKGRQLAGVSTNNTSVTFGYDVTGKRISKTVGSTVHEYTYDGSLLLCDKWGSEYIEYFYDASGSPYALSYFDGLTTEKYYFVKNIEGDILELRSSTNTLVARYIYDGWGKLLGVRDASGNAITSSTHIANLNILRYRGYVYDTETKLYYLLSRYYDPQVQRFISPDVYISTGQGIVGNNMFAYCNNCPVNMLDSLGNDAIWIQEGKTLGILGHSGLMIQDNTGTWWYFYWGTAKITFELFIGMDVDADIKLDEIGDSEIELGDINSVKSALRHVFQDSSERVNNITEIVYFEGDYTATYDYCSRLGSNDKYNLYSNNCFQISVRAMAKSNALFADIEGVIPNLGYLQVLTIPRIMFKKAIRRGGDGGRFIVVSMTY